MLTWVFRIVAVGVLTLMIGGVMALLGEADWLTAVAAALVLYLVVTTLLKGLVKKLMTLPFAAKGKVLRGADIDVHSIVPTEAPVREPDEFDDEDEDDEDWEDEDEGPKSFYLIDVTITPQEQKGKFSHWEPSELMLVPQDAPKGMDALDEEDGSYVADVHIWDGTEFAEDDPGKYAGPQRLRLHMVCDPSLRDVRFQYYFEGFGALTLPQGAPAAPQAAPATLGEPAALGSPVAAAAPLAAAAPAAAPFAATADSGRIDSLMQKIDQLEEKHGPESDKLLPSLREAARLCGDAKRWSDAQHLYERELFILRAMDTEASFVTAQAIASAGNNLAGTYFRQGKLQEAEQEAVRALDVKRTRLGGETGSLACSHENLGVLCEAQGRLDDAIKHWSDAAEVRKKILGATHPAVTRIEQQISTARQKMGLF